HRGQIVFLHAVREGPARASYGIQVARLAGVPHAVVAAARRKLEELETYADSAAPQADMVAEPRQQGARDRTAHVLQPRLAPRDLDTMTPRDAHALLAELVDEARARFGATPVQGGISR